MKILQHLIGHPQKNFYLPESLASLRFVPIHLHLLNVWLPRGNVSTEIFNRMRTLKLKLFCLYLRNLNKCLDPYSKQTNNETIQKH